MNKQLAWLILTIETGRQVNTKRDISRTANMNKSLFLAFALCAVAHAQLVNRIRTRTSTVSTAAPAAPPTPRPLPPPAPRAPENEEPEPAPEPFNFEYTAETEDGTSSTH